MKSLADLIRTQQKLLNKKNCKKNAITTQILHSKYTIVCTQ